MTLSRTWAVVVPMAAVIATMAVVACSSFSGEDDVAAPETGAPEVEAAAADGGGVVVEAGTCDVLAPFTVFTDVLGVSTDAGEYSARLTRDELTIYFARLVGGAFRLRVATRPSTSAPFGAASQALAGAEGDGGDGGRSEAVAAPSADGLELFYTSPLTAGPDGTLYVSTRSNTTMAFPMGTPAAAPLNQAGATKIDVDPFLTSTGELFFGSNRIGGKTAIFRSARSAGMFSAPAQIDELTADTERAPVLSHDGLTIYFLSARAAPNGAGNGGGDVWVAHRASLTSPFGPPSHVTELNTVAYDEPSWLSADNCRLYFSRLSFTSISAHLYVASRSPKP